MALLHKTIFEGLFKQYNFRIKKLAPKIYLTTNWPSYNQALINRGNISIWFDPTTQWYAQPQPKHGRNQTYFDIAINYQKCSIGIHLLVDLTGLKFFG